MYISVLTQLADTLVSSKVTAATEADCIALGGGAAFSRDTQDTLTIPRWSPLYRVLWLFLRMKTRIHHLHRLRNDSLTGPGCAILPPELMRYKSVDLPVPSTEIKLLRGIYQVPREQHTSPRSSLQVHSWTFGKLQFPIATYTIKAFGFLCPKSQRAADASTGEVNYGTSEICRIALSTDLYTMSDYSDDAAVTRKV